MGQLRLSSMLCGGIAGTLALLSAPASSKEAGWRQLPDGSSVYVTQRPGIARVKRCWPDGAGFDCLDVMQAGETVFASRNHRARLVDDLKATASGYRCNIMPSGFEERIEARSELDLGRANLSASEAASRELDALEINDGSLIRNNVQRAVRVGPGWTKAFVEQFVQANGVPYELRYFNCGNLAHRIYSGSPLSISTTAFSLGDMD